MAKWWNTSTRTFSDQENRGDVRTDADGYMINAMGSRIGGKVDAEGQSTLAPAAPTSPAAAPAAPAAPVHGSLGALAQASNAGYQEGTPGALNPNLGKRTLSQSLEALAQMAGRNY